MKVVNSKRGNKYDVVVYDAGVIDIVELASGARVYRLKDVGAWLEDLVEAVSPPKTKRKKTAEETV